MERRQMQRAAVLGVMVAALVLGGSSVTRAAGTPAVASPTLPSSASDRAALDKRAEYGITLAMLGEYHDAESAFASLLSASPGDARALANLGNLRVLRGDLEVALAFYGQALQSSPKDAGIVLNRATTLMLLGDVEQAEAEAARGVALAGGEAEAARLLGLSSVQPSAQRAGDQPYVSKQEIRALLQAATARVPGDSAKPPVEPAKIDPKAKKPAKAWRSAGPRAGDGGEIASVLYWKR